MILLEAREYERLKVLAEAAYPEECCAILLGRRENDVTWIRRVLPAVNMHEEPRRAYTISPQGLIAAQRKSREDGLQVVGFVHSHPNHPPKPSATDLTEAFWLGALYGIASVQSTGFGALQFYRLAGESLENRNFVPEEFRVDVSG